MAQADRVLFEQELKGNVELQQIVEGYKLLKQKESKPEEWLNYQKSRLGQTADRPIRYLTRFAAAAVVTGILLFSLYNQFSATPKVHFDFKDSGIPVLMSDKKSDLNAVMIAYKSDNFNLALQLINAYSEKHGNSDTVQYYTGVFLKEQGKYSEALLLFVPEKMSQITLKHKSQVQRAICLEYLGKKEEALSIFNQIRVEKSHLFHEAINEAFR